MKDEFNYLGAAIFWLYIVAALSFTIIIVYTLLELPTNEHAQKHRRARDVTIFSTLAVMSFVTLSINMLNVLIQSYYAWSKQRHIQASDGLVATIWSWSLTSTLFQDFGEALVGDSARWLWAQSNLLGTLSICFYIGVEGKRRKVPRLWAFFCLSQILPISFTQNLFYVALLRLEESQSTAAIAFSPTIGLAVAYYGCLLCAPYAAGPWLIPLILVARTLLAGPLCLPINVTRETLIQAARKPSLVSQSALQMLFGLASITLTLYQASVAIRDNYTFTKISVAAFDHPAVSALGCDLVISAVSTAIWTTRMGSKTSVQKAGKKLS